MYILPGLLTIWFYHTMLVFLLNESSSSWEEWGEMAHPLQVSRLLCELLSHILPNLIILHFRDSQLHPSCVLLSTQAGVNIILVVAKASDRWRMCTGRGLFGQGLDTLCTYTRDYKRIFTQGSQYKERQLASFVADSIWIQKGNPDDNFKAYFKFFWHKSSPTFLCFIDASQDQKGKDVIYQP